MRQTVYIETTVPSYYTSTRSGIDADTARTREWWDSERTAYECYISPVVLDELAEGDYPTKAASLELVRPLPLLAVNDDVLAIAETYQAAKVMPGPPVRDALHVALACFYRLSYLLTWNCRHIANANKIRHLRTINATPRARDAPYHHSADASPRRGSAVSTDSPIVDEVRARAMAISARYGHDLRRYARHFAELQQQHKDRGSISPA